METWKQNIDETKRHFTDWWNHKGIVLSMWEHFQNGVAPHADVPRPKTPADLNQKWFDPAWRADYLDWYVAHSCLKADMMPVANTQLGPGSLAAILGGVFEGGEDTIWIHPDPDFKDEIVFNENNPAWKLHKDLLKACKTKADGHYYVGMPDLMEGLDVLAAIKGTDKVLLDTVMQPEILEEQMRRINGIYFRVFDELYDIVREDDEMAFCYFSSWAPGRMTKIQSDISTMISVDDYRRFVLPFISEQCRRIDYTLYHLDGVGAMHHLDSLLEIDGLNAIQWTPGVGEPQGGSPKWYDLYRRILAAGKSIMACWVTVDELRPLLDNIGSDGVHLEMDFHNEDEVEQAMKIVDEYRGKGNGLTITPRVGDDSTVTSDANSAVSAIIDKVEKSFASGRKEKEIETDSDSAFVPEIDRSSALVHALDSRILVLDGGMGTMICRYSLGEEDFRGSEFAAHSRQLAGNNDLLSITRPDVIKEIHRKYLEAGADIITTNTFNAQRVSMSDYGLEESCRDINLAACRVAREIADEYTRRNPSKPRFVAGSVGPTAKSCSLSCEGTQPGWPAFTPRYLHKAYSEQISALIDGGVDAILIETIFDIKNARIACEAAVEAMKKAGKCVPLMLSFNVTTPDGHNMLGQSVDDLLSDLDGFPVLSVGINCVADIKAFLPLVKRLDYHTDYYISFYPNAGLPDENGKHNLKPEQFQADLWPLFDSHSVNIAGGCCGTDDTHIAAVSRMCQPIPGLFISPRRRLEPVPPMVTDDLTGLDNIPFEPEFPQEDQITAAAVADDHHDVFEAILAGKSDDAAKATLRAAKAGIEPQSIINELMINAMSEVGRRFQEGKAFVPQLLMAGRAMKAALETLKPMMAGSGPATLGKIVIGTVKGDLHDIGKNLVASMLEGCGFEVINIGIDVPAVDFVQAVRDHNADILCLSALLTTTMTYMKDVIDALAEAGLRDKVKVMVGGAPVSERFAEEIGADGYSDNANEAVTLAKRLMGI